MNNTAKWPRKKPQHSMKSDISIIAVGLPYQFISKHIYCCATARLYPFLNTHPGSCYPPHLLLRAFPVFITALLMCPRSLAGSSLD